MKSCHCTNFSFDQARKVLAPDSWQAKEAWYCNRCEAIRHAAAEERRVVRGPADATALLHADARSTGIHELTWATPRGRVQTIEYHPYPRKIPMSHPEPLLFSLWELLQSKVDVIMQGEPDSWDPNLTIQYQGWMAAKAQARGIAEALAILMKPFMESADDVVRHATRYYKDNTYEVPGLGLHLWDPLVNADGTPRTPIAQPAAQRVRTPIKMASKPAKTLSPADTEFARQGFSAGMFSKEDLASMFKVSVDVIDAALA